MINLSAIRWLRLIGWYLLQIPQRFENVTFTRHGIFPNKTAAENRDMCPNSPGHLCFSIGWSAHRYTVDFSTFLNLFDRCVFDWSVEPLEMLGKFRVESGWKQHPSSLIAVFFFFSDSEAFLHSLHAHLSWDQYQCDLGCLRCDICDLWFICGAFKHGDFLSLFVWKIYIHRFTILTNFKGLETTS